MPLPPPGCKKVKPNKHPFMAKLQSHINKVNILLEQIFDIANCDLIVTDANKGIMDYELNRKFAKKLDKLSKEFASMSGRISDVSSLISDKVDAALDHKDIKQGIVFWDEITDSKQKTVEAKNHPRTKFEMQLKIKTEHIKSTTDNDLVEIFPGEMDEHFAYPKGNENPAESHNFSCPICKAVFRDNYELRNHASNHNIEFYECLVCHKFLRSMRAFENHHALHKTSHKCPECGKTFTLKTSLYNHSQVHNKNRMKCSFQGCTHTFKHRQNQLEHITWGHRETQDLPCTICKKMFQTLTSMRAHCIHCHGTAPDIIQGHPLSTGTGPLGGTSKKKNIKKVKTYFLFLMFS